MSQPESTVPAHGLETALLISPDEEVSAPLEIGSSSADDVVGGLCRGDAGGGTPSEGVWGTPQLARTRSELYNSF